MIQDESTSTTSRELPPGMLAVTQIPARLLALGLPMGPLALLETVGRRSGQPRTTPVVVLAHRGERWLVSPFGETDWVRNVRTAPTARLGRGRRLGEVTLTSAPAELVPELLRTYRSRYRVIPFVRAAFRQQPGDSVEAYAEDAPSHPVFRIEPA